MLPHYFEIIAVTCLLAVGSSLAAEKGPLWTHPRGGILADLPMGPFVRAADGAIVTSDKLNALRSEDEGRTWASYPIFEDPAQHTACNEMLLLTTRTGTIIFVFSNKAERVWNWSDELHDAMPGTQLPLYVVRSFDGGKTWERPRKLHDAWTGANRTILQTASGEIVFTSMMLLNNPGRHATVTYTSSDDGETWQRSNLIDLGGRGHHDGAMEATIIELNDGRLWMLIRTNFGRFWQSFSDDQGHSWRILTPSNIDAGTAPGQLARLASGRLVLAWNRLYPEGRTDDAGLPRYDARYAATPAIDYRQELSVAFSEDDGLTWTEPIVIARQTGARLSYPFLFEPRPGELWITTMQAEVRLSLDENDLVSDSKAEFNVIPWVGRASN